MSNLPFSFAASALDRDWPAFEYSGSTSQSMLAVLQGGAGGEEGMIGAVGGGGASTMAGATGSTAVMGGRPEVDEMLAHQAATILSLWPEAADLEDPPDMSQTSGRVYVESYYFVEAEEHRAMSEHSGDEDEYATPSSLTATSLSTMFARRAELAQMADELGSSGSEDIESDDGTLLLEEGAQEGGQDPVGEEGVEECWAGWGVLWEEVEPPPTKKRRLTQPSLLMSV